MKKNKLWKLLIMLGLILSLVTCSQKTTPSSEEDTSVPIPPEGATEGEFNNEFVQATEISMGIFAGIMTEDDEDWYKFEVPNGCVFTMTFTPGEDAERMNVSLHNPDQDEIWCEVDISPTVTKSTTMLMNNSSGGTYYAQIGGRHGSYTIELSTESQNDADLGVDAGDDAPHALEVPVGQSFSGCQGDYDDKDWYKFDIPNGCVFTLTFTPGNDAERMSVSLHNPDQDEIWGEVDISPTVTKSTTMLMNNSSGGTYYAQIGGRHGSYTIELSTESQNDADLGVDAGDDAPHALEVPVGQSFSGYQDNYDEKDWYKFTPMVGQMVSFTSGEDTERMSVSLHNSDQDEIWGEVDVDPTVTVTFEITEVVEEPYYILVTGRGGHYTIGIE